MTTRTTGRPRKRLGTIKWLKDEGLTQDEWARLLDVHVMTVYFWLHGDAKPHNIYLDRIKERTPKCPMLREFGWNA